MVESVQTKMERHLDTLEIGPSCSWDDIEKQYRQLIQRWHPDRNSGENSEYAQSKFIALNSAYKDLKDQYKEKGTVPKRLPPPRPVEAMGTKKEIIVKVPLHKNKAVLATALSLSVLTAIVVVLWSLDTRLTENNRERATVEKALNGYSSPELAGAHPQNKGIRFQQQSKGTRP